MLSEIIPWKIKGGEISANHKGFRYSIKKAQIYEAFVLEIKEGDVLKRQTLCAIVSKLFEEAERFAYRGTRKQLNFEE
jgi:hypothetical protein